jgi:hypothetical protein
MNNSPNDGIPIAQEIRETDVNSGETQVYEAPVGDIETALAEMWSEMFRGLQIGRRDNFFRLGGNSMSGMKLLAEIARKYNVPISINSIMRYPTVEQMALTVESLLATKRAENRLDSQPSPPGDLEFYEGEI